MGTCASREKELKDKVAFTQQEYDRMVKEFLKLSCLPSGKNNLEIGVEGFKIKFPENQHLSEQIFRWIRSQSKQLKVDLPTFAMSIEILTKPQTKMFSNQFEMRQLDQAQLLLLISMQNPFVLNEDQFTVELTRHIQVTYSIAGRFVQEIINMLSGEQVNHDDTATILLLDMIFQGNNSTFDMFTFYNLLKNEAPYINVIVKKYFQGKFLDKQTRKQLLLAKFKESSLLMKNYHLALFNLCTPWFFHTKQLTSLYKFKKSEETYNFNKLANALLQSNSPTLILFRHSLSQESSYVFGFFCASYWRVAPDITGDYQSSIFSLSPKFQRFTTQLGEGQSKFALIKPIVTKSTSKLLKNTKGYSKVPGLGIGGSGYDTHRIWIDGKDLSKSYIQEEDKTYMSGNILDENIKDLNIDMIEIWALEQSTISASTTYFRSQASGQQQVPDDCKTSFVQYKDLNKVLSTLTKREVNTLTRVRTLEEQDQVLEGQINGNGQQKNYQ